MEAPMTENREKSQPSEIFALYQARLRAEEIDFAAMEQYRSDLEKDVNSSLDKLKNDHDLQVREIEREAKIQFSVTKNVQRIKILQTQQDLVSQAMEVTKGKLEEFRKTSDYRNILVKLIRQGLSAMGEDEAVVMCCARDFDMVERCLNKALEGKSNKVVLNRESPLGEEAIGGVVITNAAGTIKCDNTFSGRLQLATEGSLPMIGKILKKK